MSLKTKPNGRKVLLSLSRMSVARILETYDPVIAEERTYWKAFKVGNDDGLEFPHWDIEGHYYAKRSCASWCLAYSSAERSAYDSW